MRKQKTPRRPTDFRRMILTRLAELDKSRNWLANCGAVTATPNSVNRYLRGANDTRGEHIAQMLDVLGFTVVRRDLKDTARRMQARRRRADATNRRAAIRNGDMGD